MIDIQIEPKQFEYDIQSMVQAFYVGQPFKINEDLEESYRTLKVIFQEEKLLHHCTMIPRSFLKTKFVVTFRIEGRQKRS